MEIRMDASIPGLDFGGSHISPRGAHLESGGRCLGAGSLIGDGIGCRHATITRVGELCRGEGGSRFGGQRGDVHGGGGKGRGECGRWGIDTENEISQCFLEFPLSVDGQAVGSKLEELGGVDCGWWTGALQPPQPLLQLLVLDGEIINDTSEVLRGAVGGMTRKRGERIGGVRRDVGAMGAGEVERRRVWGRKRQCSCFVSSVVVKGTSILSA